MQVELQQRVVHEWLRTWLNLHQQPQHQWPHQYHWQQHQLITGTVSHNCKIPRFSHHSLPFNESSNLQEGLTIGHFGDSQLILVKTQSSQPTASLVKQKKINTSTPVNPTGVYPHMPIAVTAPFVTLTFNLSRSSLSLIHIWRCRRSTLCRSRWSPYH